MITKSLKGSLLLAAMISLAPAVPALAGETAEQLDAEAVRYTAMAAEQEKLGKHHKLAATSGTMAACSRGRSTTTSWPASTGNRPSSMPSAPR